MIILLVIAMLALAATAIASDPQGADGTKGPNLGDESTTDIGEIDAVGGQINELDLASNQQTQFWQLFFGNVSGWLQLKDTSDNIAYNWSDRPKYILFATNETIAWTDIAAATNDTKLDEDTAIGKNSIHVDSVNRTFSDAGAGTHPALEIAEQTIALDSAPTLVPNGAGAWATIMLTDLVNVIYAVEISSGAAYDGTEVDYQIMVPAANTSRTYYAFVELV